jgi:hypothetical protein
MRHVLRWLNLSWSSFLLECDLYRSVSRHRCYSTKSWHKHRTTCYKRNLTLRWINLLCGYMFFLLFNGKNTISLCLCRSKPDQFCERHNSVLRHSEIFRKLVICFIVLWKPDHLVRGHAVVHLVEVLRYNSEGPGVYSASKRNEYQEYFLGGKGARCIGVDNINTFIFRLS